MSVNITNITNINSVQTLGQYANDATSGLFWGIVLISVMIVITYNLRERGVDNAILASSFACFIISLILFNLQWVQILYPVILALILAATAFYKVFHKDEVGY